LRSGLNAGVHAVPAKQGLHLGVSDLFAAGGRQLLETAGAGRPAPGRGSVRSCG
jgi:hypothetical protein